MSTFLFLISGYLCAEHIGERCADVLQFVPPPQHLAATSGQPTANAAAKSHRATTPAGKDIQERGRQICRL